MQETQAGSGYKIWAVDGVVYGPVELPTMAEWIQDDRILADTWVFVEAKDTWLKASQVDDLVCHFRAKAGATAAPRILGFSLGALRRIKILGGLSDHQIERFAQLMEERSAKQWEQIFKQGEPGDAMYLVMEGELRVRLMIGGKETVLTTLGAGEFFGEMALFDSGPRSADVLANKESILLKVSRENFERLQSRAPELATPILFAIGKTLVARIRDGNRRYKDAVSFARAAGL
ncbi:MAG: cyclic nucleotide-binding domain-containing protein [Verrucomicrobia bacterium]|nr:cyclic nucleotide-binding domain-containing protein [Verrucomicrobiota bacterium]